MNPTRQLLALTATALCAGALAPGAAQADVERGRYAGSTAQPGYTGSMVVSLGILSDPARVTRIELTARLACADGTTRDVRYGKVIAFGPQLDGKRRFVHRDGGLVLRGRVGRHGRARGSFSYAEDTCSLARATWTARR
jgi:hypothetical protein